MKMDKERWQQIEMLYHAALERAPDERAAFLADACGDDSGWFWCNFRKKAD